MSATLFGAVSLTANTPTVVATGQPNTDSTINVVINNHTNSQVQVYVGYVLSTSVSVPPPQNLLSPLITLQAAQNKEFRGIALQAGYSIIVGSDTTGVTAISYGYTEGN